MSIGTPVFTTATEHTAEGTTAVPYPTIAANDYLVNLGSVNTTALTTQPSGWSTIFSDIHNSLADGSGADAVPNLSIFGKVSAGESGSLSVVHGSAVSIFQTLAIAGVDLTNPLDVAESHILNGSGGDITIPGVTTVTDGCLIIAAAAVSGTGSTATWPAGWTKIADKSTGTRCASWAYKVQSTAGATGSVLCDWSGSGQSIGALFALRPEVTAGGQVWQRWNGSAWVPCNAPKRWSGSAWV